MELNTMCEVNPEDLDNIFRGIQQEIEEKENDLNTIIHQLLEKYKYYILQDHDKKLIHRFHIRVSQLLVKCKTQNAIDYIQSISDISNCNAQNLNIFLNKIQKKSDDLIQSSIKFPNSIYVKKSIPNWQLNFQENQTIYQFYDQDFWKLYDIMLLQKQYCLNLIILHQTKQENIERLYIQSLERNQRFNKQNLQFPIDMKTLIDKAEYLNTLKVNQPISTIYNNKAISMFGNKRPKKAKININYSFSVNPQRGDPKNYDSEINRICETKKFQLFDQDPTRKRNKVKQILQNDNYITIIDTQCQGKTKCKNSQEIYLPNQISEKQNLILPEIKSPYQSDQNGILLDIQDQLTKTIQIYKKKEFLTPNKHSKKKSSLSQDQNESVCQQIIPQFKISTRDFQTIRAMIGK